MIRAIGGVLLALFVAGNAWAAAVVETLIGEASAGPALTRTAAIAKGQRIDSGNYIVTGPKSTVVLGFDDGQKMVLNENTQFRITNYSFKQDEPQKDSFSFDLIKGALRAVTSLFARRNPNAYALRIPQATIGIRGTDFMVMLVNPAFTSTLVGSIAATNAGGTTTFGAGTFGSIASSSALPVSIPASALPPSVASAFSQMSAMSLGAAPGAGAGGTGADTAAAAAEGGFGGAAAAAAGALAVGAAIAGGGGGDEGGGTTGTTGTTQ